MVARVVLILLLILHAAGIRAATIRAHLDRNPVTVNESFLLTFDVQGEADGEADFSPLEALFDILNRSQGSKIQIINGRMDRTSQWQLTLMARDVGNYTIPAISFGKDRSNSLSLVVEAETANASDQVGSVFLEAELTPQQAYVQSQLVYTVRLLRSVNLRSGSLSEPKLSGVEVMVEKLGDDRSFETLRNGVRYVVVERSFAIFPQESGTLTVEPTVFQGQIIEGSRFNFKETLRSKRVASQPFSVAVQPIPAAAQRPWLPSRELRLVEEWPQDPPRFRVGEPLTRTVTLTASGIAAAQLPSLAGTPADGLKQYTDQPLLENQTGADGLAGIRQEKIAILPSRAGRFELPAIEIPWWNTETGQQQLARIPARSIEVSAAADTQPVPAQLPVEPAPAISASQPAEIDQQRDAAGFWPWLSAVLMLGWLATALLWWRQRLKPEPRSIPRKPEKPNEAFRDFKRACRNNDAGGGKIALLRLAKNRWQERPPTSLAAIANRVDPSFADAIDELNRALYGQDTIDWDGGRLLRETQRWLKSDPVSTATHTSPIQPLHPQRE
ncbi:MAG: BatD family protein [Thiogranum sp.]